MLVAPFVIVFLTGQPKGVSPNKIKSVNIACSVDHLCSVQSVPNVGPVVGNPPVGARLSQFYQTWQALGATARVVQILKEGYILPFKNRPLLTRQPIIVSGYAHAPRQDSLTEALHALQVKNAIEKVKQKNSLAFFNRLFLVPKPNNKWRPILDLSALNKFLRAGTFKMETPETIRTSLCQGSG